MTAFEAGNFERDQTRMAGSKLRGPHLVVSAGRVAILPDIADVQRIVDQPSAQTLTLPKLTECVCNSTAM